MNRQKTTHNLSKILLTLLFTVGSLLLVSTGANAAGPISVPISSNSNIRNMKYIGKETSTAPSFGELTKKKIRTKIDRTSWDDDFLHDTEDTDTIHVYCDKPLVLCYAKDGREPYKSENYGKTQKLPLSVDPDNPTLLPKESYNGFLVSKNSTGKINIYMTITRDEKIYRHTYTLTAVKYINPFRSFVLGKTSFKNKFNTRALLYGMDGLTKKQCKNLQGGKSYSIKMKKGFSLQKITFHKNAEWAGMKFHKWTNPKILPKNFWEFYIYYRDKNGNTWKSGLEFQDWQMWNDTQK